MGKRWKSDIKMEAYYRRRLRQLEAALQEARDYITPSAEDDDRIYERELLDRINAALL